MFGISTFAGALLAIAFIKDTKAAGGFFWNNDQYGVLMVFESSSLPQNVGIDMSIPWSTFRTFSSIMDESEI